MALTWISINSNIIQGVKLINTLTTQDFTTITNQLTKNYKPNLSDDEMTHIKDTYSLTDSDLQLLLQTTSHILRQSSRFILKPTTLRKQLTENLSLEPEKSEQLIKKWTERTKEDFSDLERRKRLESVAWQLKAQTASSNGCREKELIGTLQLELSDAKDNEKSNVLLELDEEELIGLYKTLENVQVKLDAVNKVNNI